MKDAETLKRELTRRIETLPDDRLPEVLDFVGYLLYKKERPAAELAQRPGLERDPEQNPLLQLIGTVEVEPFAHEIDDELYKG